MNKKYAEQVVLQLQHQHKTAAEITDIVRNSSTSPLSQKKKMTRGLKQLEDTVLVQINYNSLSQAVQMLLQHSCSWRAHPSWPASDSCSQTPEEHIRCQMRWAWSPRNVQNNMEESKRGFGTVQRQVNPPSATKVVYNLYNYWTAPELWRHGNALKPIFNHTILLPPLYMYILYIKLYIYIYIHKHILMFKDEGFSVASELIAK